MCLGDEESVIMAQGSRKFERTWRCGKMKESGVHDKEKGMIMMRSQRIMVCYRLWLWLQYTLHYVDRIGSAPFQGPRGRNYNDSYHSPTLSKLSS